MSEYEILEANQVMASIAAEVEKQSVKILLLKRNINGRTVAYCVTVGMFAYGLPEIVIFAVQPQVVKQVVDWLGSEVVDGRLPQHLGLLPENYLSQRIMAEIVSGEKVEDFCQVVFDYYASNGMPGPCIAQWMLADGAGKFPWNVEFDHGMKGAQVMLGYASV